MRRIILSLLLLLKAEKSFQMPSEAALLSPALISCAKFKNSAILSIMYYTTSMKDLEKVNVKFFLSTVNHTELAEITSNDWSSLLNRHFDFSSKTILLVHGYKSNGQKSWVSELKNKLLQVLKANVIVVDWSDGSLHWNYVDSAQTTVFVSKKIFEFLEEMRELYEKLVAIEGSPSPNEHIWNRLYFVGHSLGAHVSAQTSNALQSNKFWKVERITGLDPASPCFKTLDLRYRLDKSDADFVDIIHTQTGTGKDFDTFGMIEDTGHADFYVNGGVLQPECNVSWYDFGIAFGRKICSHRLAYTYFMDSLDRDKCQFIGHPWDTTFEHTKKIVYSELNKEKCYECPELGINAINKNPSGKFLVIGSTEPDCGIKNDTLIEMLNNIKLLPGFS